MATTNKPTPPAAPKADEAPQQTPQAAPQAAQRVNPRAADELPPGLPHGFDQDGPRKKYRVLATYVLDDDGFEVAQGGIAELSDKLAERYNSESVTGGYGDRSRKLITPYEEPKADDEAKDEG